MKTEVNEIALSKGVYDSMRETNSRCKLFLDEILDMRNITLSNDRNSIVFSDKALNDAIRVLFNETYKKKLSALRNLDTRRNNGN